MTGTLQLGRNSTRGLTENVPAISLPFFEIERVPPVFNYKTTFYPLLAASGVKCPPDDGLLTVSGSHSKDVLCCLLHYTNEFFIRPWKHLFHSKSAELCGGNFM